MFTETLTATLDDTSTFCELSHTSAGRTPAVFDEQELIVKYLGLVQVAVARMKRKVPTYVDADDLYSMGVDGLMAAVRKFDPASERTFPGFASIRIRGAMLDGLRRMDSSSRRNRIRARELEAATNAVEQRLGRAAVPGEVRTELGLSREEYSKWVEDARPIKVHSLDFEAESAEGSGTSLHGTLADTNDETGRNQLEKAELVDLLMQHMAELPEIPKKILALYYFEDMRFAEIAEVFGLTESRISQIHRSTIQDFRKWLQKARDE